MTYNQTSVFYDSTGPFYVNDTGLTPFPTGGGGGGTGSLPSITDYGATGDGTTDDTAAIQAAINAHDCLYVPTPSVSYKAANLQLHYNSALYGFNKWKGEPNSTGNTTFVGFGGNPIFITGVWPSGVNTNNRNIVLSGFSMRNSGASCVNFYTANNPTLENIYAFSYSFTDATKGTITMRQSPRGVIRNCYILNSGGGWCVNLMDNCNTMNFSDNIMTGGSAGGVMDIGQCQRIYSKGLTIETSLYGIKVGSSSTTGSGDCHSINFDDTYMESVGIPYEIGTVNNVYNFSAKNQFMNNASNPYTEDYLIKLGKVLGWEVGGSFWRKTSGTKEFIQFQNISSTFAKSGNTTKVYLNNGTGATYKVDTGATLADVTSYNELYPVLGDATSGVYTPTLTNVTNVSASTAYETRWSRKGNVVTVSGQMDIDAISTGSSQVGISLPIASDFTSWNQAGGVGSSAYIAGMSAGIITDATNNRAVLQWISIDTANRTWQYIFSYTVY